MGLTHDSLEISQFSVYKIFSMPKRLYWPSSTNEKKDILNYSVRCDSLNSLKTEGKRHLSFLDHLKFLLVDGIVYQ